jgi:heterotetrameric sarcosine oxidase gamma subunit
MSLDFLTPRPTATAPARSPLVPAALRAGAVTEVRDGWESIATFGDPAGEAAACLESVGFADASPLAKVELQGSFAASFDFGRATRAGDGWRCPVRPDRALLLGEAATGRREDDGARACDLTAALAALVVVGPAARETFARFCALDLREEALPVGGFRPGSIARTAGFLLREDRDRFLILFGSAFSEYLWGVVADAAERLGGRPVGADSLPATKTETARA